METQSEEIRRDPRGAGKFRPGLHRFFGEMTRMQGCSGPTHVPREKVGSRAGNEVVRGLRPANYRDYCPVPSRCHRPSSYFMQVCLDRQRGSADTERRVQVRRGAANTRRGGARISPKTRGRSQWRDARPLTIFAF
jgi:hypothetical protein